MATDPFWLDDPAVLFSFNLVPTESMNLIQRLNAIVRLSLLLSVILSIFSGDNSYLLIAPVIAAISVYINSRNAMEVENFFSGYVNGEAVVLPTVDNPFGNFNKITDPKDRPPMILSYDKPAIKADIETAFNEKLYRDSTDLFNNSNQQREFYTTPCTQAMPDTTGLAKWLYSTDPTCKENGIYCAPYSDVSV